MGAGQGADTENATPSSDAQMTAGINIFWRKNGDKEDRENGDELEIWKETCPQCQIVMES